MSYLFKKRPTRVKKKELLTEPLESKTFKQDNRTFFQLENSNKKSANTFQDTSRKQRRVQMRWSG